MKELVGRTAIVTGGASGIGKGVAECFARAGIRVVIADRDLKGAAEAIEQSKMLKVKAVAIPVDVRSEASVKEMVQEAISQLGEIDILVNNAGIEGKPGNPFFLNTEEDWMTILDTNLMSVVRVSTAVVPLMVERKSGCVINMSSIAALMPGPLSPPYSTSKAAVNTFTQIMAKQLTPFNIRVNAIAPGLVWTPHWERLAKASIKSNPSLEGMTPRQVYEKRISEIVPLKTEQTPEEVGDLAVFLASDAARNMTGQIIRLDGGVIDAKMQ